MSGEQWAKAQSSRLTAQSKKNGQKQLTVDSCLLTKKIKLCQ